MNELTTTTSISMARPDVCVLTAQDVPNLRLPWDGRYSQLELVTLAAERPALSVWNRRSGEYLIGGRWRHRDEIAGLVEIVGSGGAVDLLHGFADRAQALGMRLAIASEQSERRRREFYLAAGFAEIEDIIIYELTRIRARTPDLKGLRFERFDINHAAALGELLELDHAVFPWLWWNSEAEFRQYFASPGVAIDIARDLEGRVVAYVGTTRYRAWGHLDRIAVRPDAQGRGLGRAALDYAVMTLAAAGARRVGLSTQARNTASRALYEAYGFRRSPTHDYRLYGRWLDNDTRGDEG